MSDELNKVDKSKEQEVLLLDEYIPSRPVKIRSRQGAVQTYLIGETSGAKEFWDWLDRLSSLSELAKNKKTVEWSAVQVDLIHQCITLDGAPVPKETILGWGKAIKQKLYEICMDMNGLGKDSAEKEGKDSGNAAESGGGTASPND